MFTTRHEAGRRLAEELLPLADQHPVVLGLARGGVPVAVEVAKALGAVVDVLVVRKLGSPWNPEYGFGSVGEGGVAADAAVAKARNRANVIAKIRGSGPVEHTDRTVGEQGVCATDLGAVNLNRPERPD